MTKKALTTKANHAIYLVNQGSTAQVEKFENRECSSLSSVIDSLWDEAEEQGNDALSRKLEAAYNRLTS